ncbi:MAG TPA: flagellar basal body P-ring protein FlgI, partial [Planctomycetaceae bacterium]|nr:flagellar basal body P-ring protein FlgI [Planctomycetaceae bacterium]
KQYRDSPVDFVAQVLDVGIENPHTQARVVVNSRSQVVIVTGEVEISPVVISHKNLTIEVGPQAAATPGGFVVLNQDDGRQPSQQLKQLVNALNQLRVPTSDIISIIRELHRSGKLHAVYDEH